MIILSPSPSPYTVQTFLMTFLALYGLHTVPHRKTGQYCFLFSCKDAALQALMYVCVCVCVCVRTVSIRIFQNVPECMQYVCRMFQNACRMYAECSKVLQNVPESYRKFQNVCRMYNACRSLSFHWIT